MCGEGERGVREGTKDKRERGKGGREKGKGGGLEGVGGAERYVEAKRKSRPENSCTHVMKCS